MRRALPEEVPLICPRCRRASERGFELSTVGLAESYRSAGDATIEGELACVGCARRYPIVDGVPILVPHLEGWLRSELPALVAADLAPRLAGLLAAPGPDEEPWPRLLEHLSIYLDGQWGDRATPPPDGPGGTFGFEQLAARIAARAGARVEAAVELGCGVGRGLLELARGADRVLGVDLHIGSLRRARRLLAGEAVDYARRTVGRSYLAARIEPPLAAPGIDLVCADALDPPLPPARFDRVAALNLVDAVRDPGQALAVADKLCRAGGELLLASPYAWRSGVVDEEARFGGADPAAWLTARLRSGEGLDARYTIEEEATLRWTLRRDNRSGVSYDVHWIRARKR